MNNNTAREIEKLQDNLYLIRKAGGWSAEDFGEMIGVTKQTIRNLETATTIMSKTQYIAIRSVLDYEMKERDKNDILNSTINLCLNSDDLSDTAMKQARAFVEGASKTSLDGAYLLAGLAALIGAAAVEALSQKTTGSWLSKILKNK